MAKEKILLIEDDPAISRGLSHNLQYEGYDVRSASHGSAALPLVADFCPDLLILDLMLPGKSGLEILRTIRESGNDVHVIILSARTSETEKVEGLRLGADDYIGKPFGLGELLARVDSAMRRIRQRKHTHTENLVAGDLCIQSDKTVLRNGQLLKLTPRAAELLIFFAQHPNRVFSREALLRNIWDDTYEGTARTIDNFVMQIRSQIEDDPAKPTRLETVHGHGYRFLI